jgi:hypothetical protein
MKGAQLSRLFIFLLEGFGELLCSGLGLPNQDSLATLQATVYLVSANCGWTSDARDLGLSDFPFSRTTSFIFKAFSEYLILTDNGMITLFQTVLTMNLRYLVNAIERLSRNDMSPVSQARSPNAFSRTRTRLNLYGVTYNLLLC